MAKVLFVHDHVFTLAEGRVYSSGAFPSCAWERYLSSFQSVTVAARARDYHGKAVDLNIDLSEHDNVNFEFLPSLSNLAGFLFKGGETGHKLKDLVLNHDAVIARLSSELGLLAVHYARKFNKKIGVELVDCPWDSYWNYGGAKARLYAPIVTRRVKKAVKCADSVLYVTKYFLQNRYPCSSKAESIACSNVNLSCLSERTLSDRLQRIRRTENGLNNPIIIGQISSLTGKFKGVHLVLEILPELIKHYPRIQYKVLGAGDPTPFRLKAEELGVTEHVEFCGTVPSGKPVLDWLKTIDLYVHPSLKEGLPRGVIEAMSQGCPVIASSVAGTPELLSSDYLVEPGNKNELLNKLTLALSETSQFSNLAVRNFNRSKEYSAPILSERREVFWREFAEKVK